MKKRVGKIANIPIVEGDKNLIAPNEINYEDIRLDKHFIITTNDTTGLSGNPDLNEGYKYVATAFFPVNVSVPDGVKAYSNSIFTNNHIDISLLDKVIPANVGVFITSKTPTPVFYQTTATVSIIPFDTSVKVVEGTTVGELQKLYPKHDIFTMGKNGSTFGWFVAKTSTRKLAAGRIVLLKEKTQTEE